MNMSPTLLMTLMPPPKKPIEVGDVSLWGTVEETLGTPLPDDYKNFINTFGTGVIGDFLWILNPFSANKYLNLVAQFQYYLDALRPLRDEFSDDWIHPIYPEPGGILPCGVTDNGDVLFWKTGGDPDTWTIVVFDGLGPFSEEYSYTITKFLEKLLLGGIDSDIIAAPPFNRQAL